MGASTEGYCTWHRPPDFLDVADALRAWDNAGVWAVAYARWRGASVALLAWRERQVRAGLQTPQVAAVSKSTYASPHGAVVSNSRYRLPCGYLRLSAPRERDHRRKAVGNSLYTHLSRSLLARRYLHGRCADRQILNYLQSEGQAISLIIGQWTHQGSVGFTRWSSRDYGNLATRFCRVRLLK